MTPDPALLDGIYRRPEFVWARFLETVQSGLQRLFVASFAEGSPVPWLAFAVVCAVAAVGLYRWLRLQQRRQRMPGLTPRPAGAGKTVNLEEEALQLARTGDWAGAVRLLLQAFVQRLDQLGVLAHDPARTNRELRRRLRNVAPLEPALGELIQLAELVTYAGNPGNPDLWQRARAAYERLTAVLTAGEGRT